MWEAFGTEHLGPDYRKGHTMIEDSIRRVESVEAQVEPPMEVRQVEELRQVNRELREALRHEAKRIERENESLRQCIERGNMPRDPFDVR